ncbi:zinc finger BED domain-containing protein RICESLEEPER 2-like [Hibiscus syriacus]|uniref:zinc finger BED domain-containing protein RICESLEEPER 2-like n=1 Tax=Hibiscus syriacus TaxID=106335 RepID=UPI001923C8AE|nr:zinc finger BED domain-containing protein RICESLEEPER 2-like [Hibiscus syriacus]
MDYVIFVIEEVYDAVKAEQLSEIVKQTLSELFDHYSLLSGKSQEEPSVVSQSNVSRVRGVHSTKYKRKRAESVFSEGKSELEKYLEDKVEPDVKKFDLLDWWKNKSQTYPIISVMARDILAISVSTVASESAFSTGGRVLDSFRSSLTPKIVECLICGQNWLRASPVAIQKKGTN